MIRTVTLNKGMEIKCEDARMSCFLPTDFCFSYDRQAKMIRVFMKACKEVLKNETRKTKS